MIGKGAWQRFTLVPDVMDLQFFIDTTQIATGVAGDVTMEDTSIVVAKQTDDTFVVTVNRRCKEILALIHQMCVNSTTLAAPAMTQCTVPTIASDGQSFSFRIWGQNVTNTTVVLPNYGFFVDLAFSNATFG